MSLKPPDDRLDLQAQIAKLEKFHKQYGFLSVRQKSQLARLRKLAERAAAPAKQLGIEEEPTCQQ